MVDHIESMTSSILAVPSSSPEEEAQQQARKSEESKSQSPAAEEIERYRRRIEELSQFLPNYEILGDNFYYEGARILRIDSHNGTIPSEYRREAVYEDPAAIYEFLVGDLEDVSARVIMVEDSSWALCLGLGAAFSLNPEFFIEHLHKQVPGPCGKNQSQHYTNGTFYANLVSFRCFQEQ